MKWRSVKNEREHLLLKYTFNDLASVPQVYREMTKNKHIVSGPSFEITT